MIEIARAFSLSQGAQVAISGAGGKTTALFALARAMPGPVFATTTTHLGEWQASLADQHWIVSGAGEISRRGVAGLPKVTLVSGPVGSEHRLAGLDMAALAALRVLAAEAGASILIEADGSRQRPLKAPGAHEPVIPDWVDTVIVTAGMDGIGKRLDGDVVHRAEQFSSLSGLMLGDWITPEAVARVLLHEAGGRKGISSGARSVVLLNAADTEVQRGAALRMASLLGGAFDSVVIASLRENAVHAVIEPAAAIVLAAGGAARFGAPKILQPWMGRPLVRHAAEVALAANLSPVIVVLGAVDAAARQALDGLPVQIVANPAWQSGQSSSLRAGVQALPERTGAAVFLLADQPFVTPALLRALVERRQHSLNAVVAPLVDGRRANPVLFGRETFAALQAVQGDQGGRAVFSQFSPTYVEWLDRRLLLDIDTPADYQALQSGGEHHE